MSRKEIMDLVRQFISAGPHADGDVMRRLVVTALVEGLTEQLKIEQRRTAKGRTRRARWSPIGAEWVGVSSQKQQALGAPGGASDGRQSEQRKPPGKTLRRAAKVETTRR